ncbi:glycosyltransferase [Sphingobium bisphenolivorans]|uniref:glycosyltransferase n=1 Tax=Sphingobium bisphenolivorans TaxID=1335760 RepID=UPI0003A63853|nr:glycosyltransferase family 2 protein [Sphingobium bisphenolivorans]
MQGSELPGGRPYVSVVIAAYNGEQSVGRAVESALAQSVPVEVIVVDDASTDGTRERVGRLAAQDSRVRLIESPANGGPSTARNLGIAAANGDWIAILDADDAFLPDRLQRMTLVGERHCVDIVCDNLACYDWVAGKVTGHALPLAAEAARRVSVDDFVRESMTGRSRFDYGQLKPLFRRQFLASRCLRYPPELRHGEDFALVLDCLLGGARLLLIGEALYLFTQRIGTASAVSSGQSRTMVNLEAMRDHALSLLVRPRVRRDATLSRLLAKRADAIRDQLIWSRAYPHLRARRPIALLKEMFRDWRNGPMLVRHLVRRHRNRALAQS